MQINHGFSVSLSHCRVKKSCGGPVQYLGSVMIHLQLIAKKESVNNKLRQETCQLKVPSLCCLTFLRECGKTPQAVFNHIVLIATPCNRS